MPCSANPGGKIRSQLPQQAWPQTSIDFVSAPGQCSLPAASVDFDAAASAARVLLERISLRVAGKLVSDEGPHMPLMELGCAAEPASQGVARCHLKPPGLCRKPQQCVRFNLGESSVHEVTPYSEIYGLHPREFVFDRHAYLVPAKGPFGFVGVCSSDHSDETEEEHDEEGSSDSETEELCAKSASSNGATCDAAAWGLSALGVDHTSDDSRSA